MRKGGRYLIVIYSRNCMLTNSHGPFPPQVGEREEREREREEREREKRERIVIVYCIVLYFILILGKRERRGEERE
jgi:hypothetical protein